jgi:hypothetical protein
MNEIKSLLAVGDGRGFVVEDSTHGRRYVITAAHCLPRLPTGFSIGDTHERTYVNLLGPLGGERAVSAECLFVDPVADIAVLGSPDGQMRYEEARAYEALTEDLDALQVATKLDAFIEKKAPPTIRGWLISLDGTGHCSRVGSCTCRSVLGGPKAPSRSEACQDRLSWPKTAKPRLGSSAPAQRTNTAPTAPMRGSHPPAGVAAVRARLRGALAANEVTQTCQSSITKLNSCGRR